MEVKLGYKQSEVGLIPEDWESRSLRDIVAFANGKPHEGDINEYGQYLLITLDSIGADGRLKAEHKRVRRYDGSLKKDDIVTVLSTVVSDLDQGNILGLCDLIPEDNKYVLNQRMGRLRMTVDGSPRFICFQMNRRRDHFKKRGQGTSQKHIYKRDIDSLVVPFPPCAEQRAIATALSDVDALLGGLDRLIAKKRDLKQAAMQQLLTGQTRLPGFQSEWEVKRLGDLAEIVSGGTPKTTEPAYWNGGIKWCTPTDITGCGGKYLTETERTISSLGLHSSGATLLPAGALLLCSRATIGEIRIAGGSICTNQGFKSLVCRPSVNNEFLYYKLLTMKQKMVERAFGSTFLEISKANVAALEINSPSLPEQIAIATVLSDMDAELTALEARRDKTRDLKQAMMQELLTGKTRLVTAGAAHA